jgi:peptidoglycan/LPS O-acetylase OafA/YrhL
MFCVLLWDVGIWDGFSRRGLIAEALFLQNYIGGLWFTTWSLGVEEHFYFLFAALVVVMFRLKKSRCSNSAGPFSSVPILFLIMAAGCLAGRVIAAHQLNSADFAGFVMLRVVYPSHLRMDSLMFGVLLSYWWHFSPAGRFRQLVCRWRIPLCILGGMCLAPAFIWSVLQYTWLSVYGVMIFSLGSGLLILGLLSFPSLENVPLLKPIGKLGSFSYSAYLWHGPFVVLGMEPLRKHFAAAWNDWIEFSVLFAGTWILGIIAAKTVEIPVLRLRERYFPAQL